MKHIWTTEEIITQHGKLIIRNNISKPFKNLAFARTVVFKIGFSKLRYGLCSILTDGFYCDVANTPQEFVDYLNSDEIGYRPLTKDEFLQLVDDGEKQLFY